MAPPILDPQHLQDQQRREVAKWRMQQASANQQNAHGIKQKGMENKFNEEQGEALSKEAERLIGNATMLMPKMVEAICKTFGGYEPGNERSQGEQLVERLRAERQHRTADEVHKLVLKLINCLPLSVRHISNRSHAELISAIAKLKHCYEVQNELAEFQKLEIPSNCQVACNKISANGLLVKMMFKEFWTCLKIKDKLLELNPNMRWGFEFQQLCLIHERTAEYKQKLHDEYGEDAFASSSSTRPAATS